VPGIPGTCVPEFVSGFYFHRSFSVSFSVKSSHTYQNKTARAFGKAGPGHVPDTASRIASPRYRVNLAWAFNGNRCIRTVCLAKNIGRIYKYSGIMRF
jgi:hypothetical protein